MFKGSMVAFATPMNIDGSIDFDALENLVDFHIKNKTDAIISVGTTGESATLDFSEHSKVIKTTIDIVQKRIPVIAWQVIPPYLNIRLLISNGSINIQ